LHNKVAATIGCKFDPLGHSESIRARAASH
jgi:hypothetical protein